MSRRRLLALLALAPLVAACGRKGPLERPPAEGEERKDESKPKPGVQ